MASVNYHYTFYGIIHFTDYGNQTNIWLVCPSFGNFEIISSFSTKILIHIWQPQKQIHAKIDFGMSPNMSSRPCI